MVENSLDVLDLMPVVLHLEVLVHLDYQLFSFTVKIVVVELSPLFLDFSLHIKWSVSAECCDVLFEM
jgi:hypothetical protein